MRQHITKEQWDELSDGEKHILNFNVTHNGMYGSKGTYPIIGELIEYLGEDLKSIRWDVPGVTGGVIVRTEKTYVYELIDALWEATKYKLRNDYKRKASESVAKNFGDVIKQLSKE